MSNQRVVVLTDEEIKSLLGLTWGARKEELRTLLEHPEGITDDMVERSARALWKQKRNASRRPYEWEFSRVWWEQEARLVLEAAFFPGEDNE